VTMQRYERKNTLVCIFDKHSPRITAYEIHEWIYQKFQLNQEDITTIQIEGPTRQVCIKTTQNKTIEDLINKTQGETTYDHAEGVTSKVQLCFAGLGKRNVRIANLPPELPNEVIRTHLSKYGTIQHIMDETWSHTYRYCVGNGIRIVTMDLTTHVPSHLRIEGYRALISYNGQPVTCYICNATDHMAQDCHKRKPKQPTPRPTIRPT
jgi:predicted AlkP superfamily pyrophosphatase or phosphodiesterase